MIRRLLKLETERAATRAASAASLPMTMRTPPQSPLPAWTGHPLFRWLMRGFALAEAIEAAQYLGIGGIALAAGYGVWRTSVPVDDGSAVWRALRDGHDVSAIMFAGLGGLSVLYGAYALVTFVRDMRDAKRRQWI